MGLQLSNHVLAAMKGVGLVGGLPSANAYADASRPTLIGVSHDAISDSCEEKEVNVRANTYSGA